MRVRTEEGGWATTPEEIADHFVKYYKGLYTTEGARVETEMQEYITRAGLTHLFRTERAVLESPISSEEIRQR